MDGKGPSFTFSRHSTRPTIAWILCQTTWQNGAGYLLLMARDNSWHGKCAPCTVSTASKRWRSVAKVCQDKNRMGTNALQLQSSMIPDSWKKGGGVESTRFCSYIIQEDHFSTLHRPLTEIIKYEKQQLLNVPEPAQFREAILNGYVGGTYTRARAHSLTHARTHTNTLLIRQLLTHEQ